MNELKELTDVEVAADITVLRIATHIMALAWPQICSTGVILTAVIMFLNLFVLTYSMIVQ